MNEARIAQLDSTLVAASSKIKVLSALAWPPGAEEQFLEQWRAGNPRLPEVQSTPRDVSSSIAALESIAAQCDEAHPVEKFLRDTAWSYANAGRMLGHIGTPEFTRYSIRLYGRPDTVYQRQGISPVDGANFFLEVTRNLLGDPHLPPTVTDIPSASFAAWLRPEIDRFFTHDSVEVELDPSLSSKAIAGANRIRVRESALFSQLDKDQLLQHEAFVHTATQLNGRKQPNLKSLGLGAPRTTRTQEGIAVIAELITNSMDLIRLRRIALRVIAVKMALDGADFIDLFRFFLDAGQSEEEAVRSAQRIFRGGGVKDGVVFTKDSVYLEGLIEVHTYLRIAIRDNRPELIRNLFAGRLTIADSLRLDPFFQSGWLAGPVYMPSWAADLRRLAATMAYSAFITNVKLEGLTIDRAIEFEAELEAAHR